MLIIFMLQGLASLNFAPEADRFRVSNCKFQHPNLKIQKVNFPRILQAIKSKIQKDVLQSTIRNSQSATNTIATSHLPANDPKGKTRHCYQDLLRSAQPLLFLLRKYNRYVRLTVR